MIYIFK